MDSNLTAANGPALDHHNATNSDDEDVRMEDKSQEKLLMTKVAVEQYVSRGNYGNRKYHVGQDSSDDGIEQSDNNNTAADDVIRPVSGGNDETLTNTVIADDSGVNNDEAPGVAGETDLAEQRDNNNTTATSITHELSQNKKDHIDDESVASCKRDLDGNDAADGLSSLPAGANKRRSEPKTDIRRIRYSNDFKVKVLDELEVARVTVAEMSRRHKLPEATLRDWIKNKDKIVNAKVNRRGTAKSNSRDHLQRITDALISYIDMNDRLGISGMDKFSITNDVIAKLGRHVKTLLLEKDNEEPFLNDMERAALHKFSASQWWAKKWSRKHNLHSVEREADAAATAISSSQRLWHLQEEYPPERIFFVIDTMLFHKVLPTRDYNNALTENTEQYAQLLKDRTSIFVSANATGTHKVPLAMLGNQRLTSQAALTTTSIPYVYRKHVWADPPSLLNWWKRVFLPDIRKWTNENILLVLHKPTSIELEDPTHQVCTFFLPPLSTQSEYQLHSLEQNIRQTINNDDSQLRCTNIRETFYDPPRNTLVMLKKRYRYALAREIFAMFPERYDRRRVAQQAGITSKGLRQGYLPDVTDCMRLIYHVWTKDIAAHDIDQQHRTPAAEQPYKDNNQENIYNDKDVADDDPKDSTVVQHRSSRKKRNYRKRKRKNRAATITEAAGDVVEEVFRDDPETVDFMRDLLEFLNHNQCTEEVSSDDEGKTTDWLNWSIMEIKNCFLNIPLRLRGKNGNRFAIQDHIYEWIRLEESQGVQTMLQHEIVSKMKLQVIVGDNRDGDDNMDAVDEERSETRKNADDAVIDESVATDVAMQLLKCAVRLSNDHPCYHSLASRLIEASNDAFVAVRNGKLQKKLTAEKAKAPKKRFKYLTKRVTQEGKRHKATPEVPPPSGDATSIQAKKAQPSSKRGSPETARFRLDTATENNAVGNAFANEDEDTRVGAGFLFGRLPKETTANK